LAARAATANPPRDRAAAGPHGDAQRAAATLLRWRAWWLGHHLPRRHAAAARLFPVLLHASFPVARLSGEAPGVSGLAFRRRWSSLARELDLPPPHRMQRGRPLVDAVLAIPTPRGLDLLVLVAAETQSEELGALQERMEAAEALFRDSGAPVRASIYPPARLADDPEVGPRALAFGGLLAGRPSPAAWAALEESASRPIDGRIATALAASAPTPLATLALTLLSRHPAPGPLPAARALLLAGEAARRLASPDLFAVRWAGRVPALRAPLEEALALAQRRAEAPGLAAVMRLGIGLAIACTGAIRRARGRQLDRRTKRLWQEALGPGMPRVLLPALGDLLRAHAARQGRLRLDPVRAGRGYEVRLADGTALGRGRDPVQARIRALGLCAQACAAGQDPAATAELFRHLDPTWRVIGKRLAQPRDRVAQVLVVEAGGGSRPGPPFDVLNRGLERAMEFEGAIAVAVTPGRRPSGRMLSAREVVEAVIRRAADDTGVEILASRAESRPVASRLGQIAQLVRDAARHGPVALEAGGQVYLPFRGGLRRYGLARFASRPRRFTPDPEAPDLAAGPGERPARGRLPAGMLACRVTLCGNEEAALLFADGEGGVLREVVPLAELEEHLRETRSIVGLARPPAVLTVRLSDDVEAEVRRTGQVRDGPSMAVRGILPRVEVEVGGERFGGGAPLGWDAAADALLARWPAQGGGRIGVSAVTATVADRPASPLLALWAASMARRRLRPRLERSLQAYRRAAAGRRTP